MSASGDPIRLLVVDDHAVVRDGLRGMFGANPDFDVVGLAANGAEALELARTLYPQVILMDLRMPDMDGVSVIQAIRHEEFSARVIVFTTYDNDGDSLRAIEAGASGYLLKGRPPRGAVPRGTRRRARRGGPRPVDRHATRSARCAHQ